MCWMFNEPCDDEIELKTYCSCYDFFDGNYFPCSNDKCNWNYEMMFWHMSMTDIDGNESISREECDTLYDMESVSMCHEVLDHCDTD